MHNFPWKLLKSCCVVGVWWEFHIGVLLSWSAVSITFHFSAENKNWLAANLVLLCGHCSPCWLHLCTAANGIHQDVNCGCTIHTSVPAAAHIVELGYICYNPHFYLNNPTEDYQMAPLYFSSVFSFSGLQFYCFSSLSPPSSGHSTQSGQQLITDKCTEQLAGEHSEKCVSWRGSHCLHKLQRPKQSYKEGHWAHLSDKC